MSTTSAHETLLVELRLLTRTAEAVKESWADPVQVRFYEEFIDPVSMTWRVLEESVATLDVALKMCERGD